ncbi:hypothetical protein LKD74_12880 [Intestinimonas sp. CLA-AA-H199]|nr:hypothetical protein [Intestinimonas aquisgranensis]
MDLRTTFFRRSHISSRARQHRITENHASEPLDALTFPVPLDDVSPPKRWRSSTARASEIKRLILRSFGSQAELNEHFSYLGSTEIFLKIFLIRTWPVRFNLYDLAMEVKGG